MEFIPNHNIVDEQLSNEHMKRLYVENEKDLYPTIECDNEDWANKFTESIRTFHGINL